MRQYKQKKTLKSVFDDKSAYDMYKYLGDNFKKLSSSPIMWDDFLVPFLGGLAKSRDTNVNQFAEGPVTIRVCPSEEELVKLKPAEILSLRTQSEVRGVKVKEFTIDKPITVTDPRGRAINIWMSKHAPMVYMDPGWVDGEKNNYSPYGWGVADPIAVHSLIAGMTGAGKSVCNNTVIFNMLYRYAPWEVQLFMTDAKAVEFKRYADSHHIPHVRAIAAATDQSYATTLLDYIYNLMDKRKDIFQRVGVQNLKDFCRVTNTRLPVIILAMEEFQAMFKMTTNDEKRIVLDRMDKIGRLGRSMGIYMHMASQEIGSDLPKEILSQVALRMALKLSSSASQQVINNTAAANINQMGILYVNSQTTVEDCERYNTMFRVPYQTEPMFNAYGKILEEAGKEFGFGNICKSYDENKILDSEEYTGYLNSMPKDRHKLYLGLKAVYDISPEPLAEIQLGESVAENIIMIGGTHNDYVRQIRLLTRNWDNCERVKPGGDNSKAVHVRLVRGQSKLGRELKFLAYTQESPGYLTSVEDDNFETILQTPFLQLLAFEADELVFANAVMGEDIPTKNIREFIIRANPAYETSVLNDLSNKRIEAILKVLKTNKQIKNGLGGESLDKVIKLLDKDGNSGNEVGVIGTIALKVLMIINKYVQKGVQATADRFPVTYFVLSGVDDVIDLFSGKCYRPIDRLVKSLQAGTASQVRYVIILDRYNDYFKELIPAANFLMSAGVPSVKLDKFAKGFDTLPELIANLSCVLNFKLSQQIKYIRYTIPEDTE